ncbi:MAG: nucleotide-binding protein, partial [Planctomycetota bacterium]
MSPIKSPDDHSMWAGVRNRVDEQMDAPDLDPIAHRAALKGLRRLNTISGVSLVLFPQLLHFARQQPNRPLKILDVASGSADLPIAWIKRARRRGLEFQITALDRSETALKAAA